MKYEQGKQYWLTYKDGSRILVTAYEDKYGEIDLRNVALDFGIWSVHAGPGRDYQVSEVEV